MAWTTEAKKVTNYLASIPQYGHTTVEKNDLRSLLLETGGQLLARGLLYDIVSKNLGAGVYKVSLKEHDYKEKSS